jgi:signal transduction histidine kinase
MVIWLTQVREYSQIIAHARLEEEMEKIETQLQPANQKEAIGTLSRGMIHDLNNILSSIIGFTELAKMGLRSGANVEKDLDEVLKAGLRARDLLSRISRMS